MFIFSSYLYGVFLHEFSLEILLYALRLYAMAFSGYMIGKIFFLFYQSDILGFLKNVCSAYMISILIGFVIFIFFPASQHFWSFLESFGVVFHGDPHIHRFVSCYFDPNYFSAIACITFLFSYITAAQTNRIKDKMKCFLFFIAILLSWSRSGIMTLGFLLFFYILDQQMMKGFRIRNLFVNSLFFLLLVASIFYFSDELVYFLKRSFHFLEEDSALYRFASFKLGWEWLKERPLLGTGYHFISLYTREQIGLSALDSSLLNTLINFGFIGSGFLFIAFGIFSYNQWTQFKRVKSRNILLFNVFKWLYIYTLIMLFFTSQFNNCLYYPFWLIPIIGFWTYLNECKKYESSFST